MVARKEALGPQPDDAAAFRTTISADAKRLIKAVENHLHEIMKPYPWMPAAGAIVGPRPGIIAAVFGNLVEIQQERRYHGITFCGGGSPASGFVDGGCWRTHRPVFFKIKKDPCSQGPLNLKFSACLSTDSENYPLPPNTLLWDATYVMQNPFTATDQYARIVLVWLTFMGAAVATLMDKNVRIDTFEQMFPAAVRRFLSVFFDIVLVYLLGVLTVKGCEVYKVGAFQSIVGTPFSYQVMFGAQVAGSVLMAFFVLVRLCGKLCRMAGGSSHA